MRNPPLAPVLLLFSALSLLSMAVSPGLEAQAVTWRAVEGLPVGSEVERYLRVLQVAGKAPLHPWTVREITPGQLSATLPAAEDHPWRERLDFTLPDSGAFRAGWTRSSAGARFNSGYPTGENDGVVWMGKGFTGVASGGGYLSWGRLHLRVSPVAFFAQNAAFPLADNGRDGPGAFRDGRFPTSIDHPQRFGDEAVVRFDPGASSLHLALPGLTLSASTMGQVWGPALHYPLLLGNNAGGFPHLAVQTSGPLDLWAFRLHARHMVGTLEQSDFSPVQGGETRRLSSGAVVAVLPRGLEGLEVGAARFVTLVWPAGGIEARHLFRPFSGIVHNFRSTENPSDENQLASLFFRWVVQSAGVEIYGGMIREDFARSFRGLVEEPDDLSGRMFGFQKVWNRSERLVALRGEIVNAQVHHSERLGRFWWNKVPNPYPRYRHPGVRQGHTHHGQILGSPTVYGGSGWTLGLDLYEGQGRWSVDLSRRFRADWLAVHDGTRGPGVGDVVYTLGLEAVRFRAGWEWRATLAPSVNLNRNVQEGNHAFNLGIGLEVRGLPW